MPLGSEYLAASSMRPPWRISLHSKNARTSQRDSTPCTRRSTMRQIGERWHGSRRTQFALLIPRAPATDQTTDGSRRASRPASARCGMVGRSRRAERFWSRLSSAGVDRVRRSVQHERSSHRDRRPPNQQSAIGRRTRECEDQSTGDRVAARFHRECISAVHHRSRTADDPPRPRPTADDDAHIGRTQIGAGSLGLGDRRRDVAFTSLSRCAHQRMLSNSARSFAPRPAFTDAMNAMRPCRWARKSARPSRFCD